MEQQQADPYSAFAPESHRTVSQWAVEPARWFVFTVLRRMKVGCLRVALPDGTEFEFGDPASPIRAELQIRDESIFADLVGQGSWGLGWGYADGRWDSPSAFHVCLVLVLNEARFRPWLRIGETLSVRMRSITRTIDALSKPDENTREQALGIAYNVGNDFFEHMLGPSMTYTGGIWEKDDETLETAQENKLRAVVAKAGIESHHRVLDIGCGWGTLCGWIRRHTGADSTGISLASEQVNWARQHFPDCRFELIDYGRLEGTFDRIVSVGMAEHVGRASFGGYLAAVAKLLPERGRFVMDTMLSYDGVLMATRKRRWLSFASLTMPNADVPSMSDVVEASMQTGCLRILHTETLGLHYARTCHEWQRNLHRHRDEILASYSERTFRIYDFSWAFARAILETGMTSVQVVFERVPFGSPLRLELPTRRAGNAREI